MIKTNPVVTYRDGYIEGFYEPGNSTRYTAVAIPTNGHLQVGSLGLVTDGWIVVSGMANRQAYLLSKHPYLLHPDYIEDKFDLHGQDAEMFTILLKAMLKES